MTHPVIVMDEAGNTGENLLDAHQPIFGLAALRIDASRAEQAVENARSRAQQKQAELKFSSLRGSNAGRKNVLALFHEIALDPADAAVIVVHKRWMLAAKLVDELIEPRMLAKGVQPAWYASGAALSMAETLAELGPSHLGGLYEDFARAFVEVVRRYSDDRAGRLLVALNRCKLACRREDLHDLLSGMIDTPAELAAAFSARTDALDPALTSLFWQGGYWSSHLGSRFEFVHDESTTVSRWQNDLFEEIQRRMADRSSPESFEVGDVTIHLPSLMDTISFGTSHADSRIQIADLLVGAATHWYGAHTGAREDREDFAPKLLRAGVPKLIQGAIGPRPRGVA